MLTLNVDLFFEVLAFLVVVGVVYYSHPQIASAIKKLMDEREKEIELLKQQARQLIVEEEKAEKKLAEQTQVCKKLQHNVTHWSEDVNQKHKQEAIEWQTQQKEIIKHIEFRQKKLAMHRLEQEVLPVSINKVKKQMQERFADEKSGQDFIALLIEHVRKEGA